MECNRQLGDNNMYVKLSYEECKDLYLSLLEIKNWISGFEENKNEKIFSNLSDIKNLTLCIGRELNRCEKDAMKESLRIK